MTSGVIRLDTLRDAGYRWVTSCRIGERAQQGRREDADHDTWITAKTKIALFANARIKGSEITVETSQGSVTIRGKVDSDAAKRTTEEIAKGIDGVKTVKNDLQVIASAKRGAIDDKDETITVRVNEQIAKDSYLNQAGIAV